MSSDDNASKATNIDFDELRVSARARATARANKVNVDGVASADCRGEKVDDRKNTHDILLDKLQRSNLGELVLDAASEDVYEEGKTLHIEAEGNVQRHRTEVLLDVGSNGQLSSVEHKKRPGPEPSDASDEECEQRESVVTVKISEILNRIVVRRQRAYLTGLLLNRSRARTAALVRQYSERASSGR